MNKFFDVRTPIMLPLWRRIAFCGFTVAWGLNEVINGSFGFGLLFLAAGAFLGHQFFIVFDREDWESAARENASRMRPKPTPTAQTSQAPEAEKPKADAVTSKPANENEG